MRSLIIFLILLVIPITVYGERVNTNEEVNLSTNPGKILFDISNVKPGDFIKRNIVIHNNGKNDFDYIITNKYKSGSDIFYKQLILKIEDSKNILYEGNLYKFNKLSQRYLKSKTNESLLLTIYIPLELGNEFQGHETEFEFKIYVEGTLGGVLPVDNKLPTTGSEMFNLLAIGAAILLAGLILFGYVKRKKLYTKRP